MFRQISRALQNNRNNMGFRETNGLRKASLLIIKMLDRENKVYR